MERETHEARQRLLGARRALHLTALGVLIAGGVPWVGSLVESATLAADGIIVTLWLVVELVPLAVSAGLLLAFVGTLHLARGGFAPPAKHPLGVAAAASTVTVLTWGLYTGWAFLGGPPTDLPGVLVVVLAWFAGGLWFGGYAWGLSAASRSAGLKGPATNWKVVAALVGITLAATAMTLLLQQGLAAGGSLQQPDAGAPHELDDQSGMPSAVGAYVLLPLFLIVSFGPFVAWAAFLVASSVTYRALRTLQRAAALRARSEARGSA